MRQKRLSIISQARYQETNMAREPGSGLQQPSKTLSAKIARQLFWKNAQAFVLVHKIKMTGAIFSRSAGLALLSLPEPERSACDWPRHTPQLLSAGRQDQSAFFEGEPGCQWAFLTLTCNMPLACASPQPQKSQLSRPLCWHCGWNDLWWCQSSQPCAPA